MVTYGLGTWHSKWLCRGGYVIIASRNQAQCESRAESLIQRLEASADHGDHPALHSGTAGPLPAVWVSRCLGQQQSVIDSRSYQDPAEARANHGGQCHRTVCYLACLSQLRWQATERLLILADSSVVAPDFSNYAGTEMTTPPDYHFHKHGLIQLTKYLATWAANPCECDLSRRIPYRGSSRSLCFPVLPPCSAEENGGI